MDFIELGIICSFEALYTCTIGNSSFKLWLILYVEDPASDSLCVIPNKDPVIINEPVTFNDPVISADDDIVN